MVVAVRIGRCAGLVRYAANRPMIHGRFVSHEFEEDESNGEHPSRYCPILAISMRATRRYGTREPSFGPAATNLIAIFGRPTSAHTNSTGDCARLHITETPRD